MVVGEEKPFLENPLAEVEKGSSNGVLVPVCYHWV